MAGVDTKVVAVRKFGWKRIAKNFCRFGWHLSDAEEERVTTYETTYEASVYDDKVYVKPHTTSNTKITMWLSFWRNSNEFTNLGAIWPLELIYNIIFLVRKIVAFFLPFVTIIMFLGMMLNFVDPENSPLVKGWIIGFIGWIVLIILEGILARIAAAILKVRV